MSNMIDNLIIFIFALIDSAILYYISATFERRALHIALFGIFYLSHRKKKEEDLKYFDVLILITPIIGYIGLIIQNIFYKSGNFKVVIQDLSDYDKDILMFRNVKKIDIEDEISVLPANDLLTMESSEVKKKFYVDVKIKKLREKVKVLKKGLKDKDMEVVHYAAVNINKLEKEFHNRIYEYRQDKDVTNLVNAYMEYCISGLLEEEVFEFYDLKVKNYLESQEIQRNIDPLTLLHYYDLNNEKIKIHEFLQKYLKKEDAKEEIIEYSKIFYYENDLDKVIEI